MVRVAAILVVALVAASAPPAAAAPTVTVSYLAPAPDITAGTTWYQGHQLLTFDAVNVFGDNSVVVYGVWHESALYLAAEVSDLNLWAGQLPNDSGITWENDAIELLFDPTLKGGATISQGDPAFRQYIFTIAGTTFDAYGCCAMADTTWNGTATFTVTLHGTLNGTGTGYLMEMRVPWADLGVTPHAGLAIGFDIANDDRDDFGQSSPVIESDWVGLYDTFAQPSLWGRLQLAGGPDGGVADGGVAHDGGSSGGTTGPTGAVLPPAASGCGCRAAPGATALPLLLFGAPLLARRGRRPRA